MRLKVKHGLGDRVIKTERERGEREKEATGQKTEMRFMQHLNAPISGQCCRPSDASIISLSKTFAFHLIPPSRVGSSRVWAWALATSVALVCKHAKCQSLKSRLGSGIRFGVPAETHETEFISQFPLQFRKLNEKALKNIQKQQPSSQTHSSHSQK